MTDPMTEPTADSVRLGAGDALDDFLAAHPDAVRSALEAGARSAVAAWLAEHPDEMRDALRRAAEQRVPVVPPSDRRVTPW